MSWISHGPGKRTDSRRRGASLVELLMVTAILGLLMTLAFEAYFAAVRDYGGGRGSAQAVIVDPATLAMSAASDRALQVPAEPTLPPPGDDYIADQYLIRFGPGVTNPAETAQNIASAYPGGRVLHVYDSDDFKGCNLYLPGATSERLTAEPHVQAVEREGRCYITAETVPTGVRRTSVAYAKPRLVTPDPATLGLPNVQGSLARAVAGQTVVAVIDTGIDGGHADLRVTRSLGFGQPNGNDENGHGTHVAGTIGAKANSAGVVGVFPGVGLWSLRILDRSGSGSYGNLAAALRYVSTNSSQIAACNLSIGGPKSQTINDLVNACAAKGVSMVVAAGNERRDAATSSPASAAKAVCVAALADTDGLSGGRGGSTSVGADDTFASFSNYGTTVDVIAPGVNILSTYFGNRYASMSGTSMATPHVAGLLGLHSTSVVSGSTGNRRASGLELVSLLLRYRGVELIKGRYDGRQYPLVMAP